MVVEENCERLAVERISSVRERKTQGYPFESGMVRCFGSSAETQALENVQGARDDAKISSSGASKTHRQSGCPKDNLYRSRYAFREGSFGVGVQY